MKTLRRLLIALGAGLLALAAAVALLIAVLLFRPGALLNSRSAAWGLRRFGRAYEPKWKGLELSIRSPDPFEKEVSLAAEDFCFAKADGSLSGCFRSLDVRFALELAPTGVRVTELSRLDAKGERLRVAPAAGAPKAAARSSFDPYRLPRLLPGFLRGIRIGEISVDLPSVEVAGPSGTTLGAARLAFDRASAAPLTLDARWRSRAAGRVQGGSARVAVASDFLKTGQLTRLDATGKVRADGESAEFSVKARQAGADAVALEARASGESASARFRFSGKGRQTPRSNELAGELAVAASTGPVKSLRLDPIRFELDRGKGGAWSALRVEAGLRAEPVGLRTVRGFTPPRFIVGRATLNVRAAPMAFQPDHFDADLSILLNPYMSWYEAHADLYVRAAGRLGALSKARIQERLDASASVARFKDLVAFLAGTPYAVPAPLDALEGGLRASFSARGEPGSDRVEFDYGARADLSGGKQRLKLHVSGSGGAARAWTPERSVETRGTVTLDDVAVQLPDLDPLKMPKATLDSRIKDTSARAARRSAAREPEEGAAASTASFVAMRLNVVTARPVILYSNLALSPVPITLDLALAKPPGSATGNVSVGTFDAEFFRRRATVEHVDLSFRPDSKLVALDGLVNYKAAEALIHIKLLGTVEKPQVVFESDPPLSQSDIVSMLVFGKSPDELDADQASTVANSQTAMTDEAFGLASLYLFASTPIQFVGYDPATKSYSLKFRLPGGETLSLNSDFESTNSVQLRKRLSRHFAIEAEAVNSQTEGNGVVTFLEWFTRY